MIRGAMRTGLMFVFNQGRDVFGPLDLLPPIEAAGMRGDHRLTIENADVIQTGGHGERAGHAGVRDRVVVEVEAHIRRLAGRHGLDLVGRKGIAGQGQQPSLLLEERFAHRQ